MDSKGAEDDAMCLAVPGRIVEVREGEGNLRLGTVEFGGVSKSVCLAYVPEAAAGDYVLVHVGFAISRVDEAEAKKVFEGMRRMQGDGSP